MSRFRKVQSCYIYVRIGGRNVLAQQYYDTTMSLALQLPAFVGNLPREKRNIKLM